ncbi:hypothetical protein [Marivita sp. S2033]
MKRRQFSAVVNQNGGGGHVGQTYFTNMPKVLGAPALTAYRNRKTGDIAG